MISANGRAGFHPPTDTDRRRTRRLRTVAAGGFGILLTSSVLQALDLVPLHLQHQVHGATIVIAAIGLLYLFLPRKARITLEWER